MTIDWEPSDDDAFQVSIKDYAYYYAIQAELDGKGRHWYKESKKTGEITEVPESEIIQIVQDPSIKKFKVCPCVKIRDDGHLEPLVMHPIEGNQ